MKNAFFAILIIFAALISCRGDEESVQKMDQILHIYIDSAGKDMLNNTIEGSYQTVVMNDEYGITDTAPVQFSLKYDKDSLRYIEYVSGARRIGIDSSDVNSKIYQSEIELILTQKKTNSTTTTTSTFSDVLVLNYALKPEVFRIEKAWYNNNLVFTKQDGQPNIIKVTK